MKIAAPWLRYNDDFPGTRLMVTKSRNQSTATSARRVRPRKPRQQLQLKPRTATAPRRRARKRLRGLYGSLLRCRMVQERARELSAANYELAIGHEAMIAAPTAQLNAEDTIAASSEQSGRAGGARAGAGWIVCTDRMRGPEFHYPSFRARGPVRCGYRTCASSQTGEEAARSGSVLSAGESGAGDLERDAQVCRGA